ncbi:MAG TPA: serine/threonine-protein kinase [Phycisphaerae bacterium]|nr:serine/threonine-protein kinase [Phycisphaerae bacterium]
MDDAANTSTRISSSGAPTVVGPPSGERAAEPIPQRIGNYRVIRKIGEGGMGSVYEAEQDKPSRRVALKVIRPGYATAQALRRFELEAQVLGRLQHPGIAQVYEAGTADTGLGPQPYFAMEFIDGAALLDFAAQRELGTRQRLELMARICDAVHHAHQKGVIHRDLKPGNILVVDEGTTFQSTACRIAESRSTSSLIPTSMGAQPKVLDFGIARATDSDIQATTMHTDVGQIIGTIPYMSPEQVAADPQALDTRSDVYALGVIAYELLAGRLPYDIRYKLIHEAVRVIREDEPTPLSTINRVFRGDVETIVGKALEKERLRRYQSAAELAEDIRRFLRDEPIVARPASTLYQLRKFAQRNRALVGGVAAVFIVLVAGTVISTGQYLKAAAARDEARRERDRAVLAEQRAQENFRMAGEAVNQYLTRVGDSPDLKARGLETLRRELLETARGFYDRFLQQKSDDPALQADLGDAHINLGNIDRIIARIDHAEASYTRARDVFESLVRAAPTEPLFRRKLATAWANLGLLYADSNRRKESEACYRRAFEVEDELAKLTGRTSDDDSRWANTCDNFGILLGSAGRGAEAEASYQQGMAIREKLVNESPDEPAYRNELARSYNNLAQFCAMNGRAAEAETHLLKAIPIAQRLVHEKPESPDYQTTLAATYGNLAGVYILTGRSSEAGETYRKSLPAREKLANEHPLVLEYALFHGSVYCNLGELDTRAYQPEASLPSFAEAIRIMRGVLEREARHATARFYLSYTLSWRARAFGDMGRWADALADWNDAIGLDDRNNASLRAGRALAAAHLGKCAESLDEAKKIAPASSLEPETLYDLAAVVALCSEKPPAVGTDAPTSQPQTSSDDPAAQALALLSRADAAGLFQNAAQLKRVMQDSSFDRLRSLTAFQEWLAAKTKKSESPAPAGAGAAAGR